jgi:hypothetical protein
MLLGRRSDCAAVEGLLDNARAGRSGTRLERLRAAASPLLLRHGERRQMVRLRPARCSSGVRSRRSASGKRSRLADASGDREVLHDAEPHVADEMAAAVEDRGHVAVHVCDAAVVDSGQEYEVFVGGPDAGLASSTKPPRTPASMRTGSHRSPSCARWPELDTLERRTIMSKVIDCVFVAPATDTLSAASPSAPVTPRVCGCRARRQRPVPPPIKPRGRWVNPKPGPPGYRPTHTMVPARQTGPATRHPTQGAP